MPPTPQPNEARLNKLFLDLCRINSPSLAEAHVIAFTRRFLESQGLECWEDSAGAAIGGNGNNLIVKLPGTRPGPTVFLSAHFDTVEPTAGLQIVEEDGVYKTDGKTILGADDKGGMAPAIEALLTIKESGVPHGTVYLLLSVAEEIGLQGAKQVIFDDLDIDYGFVLDTGPPVGSFVTKTGTHDHLYINLIGKPAHAGKEPEHGISAIQIAARAIEGMRLGRIDENTTANLGVISGGTGINVVCPSVSIRGEARSFSPEAVDIQVDHMIQKFEEAARFYGGRAEIHHIRQYTGFLLQDGDPVVEVAKRASQNLGLEPTMRSSLGGSDANIYNGKGIPTIVVATGMRDIHTHAESISKADLLLTAKLAIELVLESK